MIRPRHSLLGYLPLPEAALATEFFGAFAMAEYSLKTLGYIRQGREDAQADWSAYARTIQKGFREAAPRQFKRAWEALTQHPPRKQVSVAGRLAWKDTPRPAGMADAAWGLLLVRRVRNNLFHGAKFTLGGSDQFRRDRDLISAALMVLDHAMRLARPAVRRTRSSSAG